MSSIIDDPFGEILVPGAEYTTEIFPGSATQTGQQQNLAALGLPDLLGIVPASNEFNRDKNPGREVGDFIFGDEGTAARAVDMTPDEFASLREGYAGALRGQFSGEGAAYGGRLTAGMSGGESKLLSALRNFQQPTSFRDQVLTNTLDPQALQQRFQTGPQENLLQSVMEGRFLSPDSNPFLRDTIEAAQRPLLQRFEQDMGNLRGEFTRAGHFTAPGASSPFETAKARLQTGLAQSMGDVGTRIASENLARERGLQMNAISQALQQAQAQTEAETQRAQVGADVEQRLGTQQIEGMLQNLRAQALPRMIEDLGIERGLQEFQRQQQQLLDSLAITSQITDPSSVVLPGMSASPGLINSFLSGGGAEGVGAAAAAYMFSDPRVKQDAEKVSQLDNGLSVYLYRYTKDGPWQLGTMADEVEEVKPHAVTEIEGLKIVNMTEVMH